MSELEKMLGEELYSQVMAKVGDKKIDLLDNYIPKSRFNEVNDKVKALIEKVTSYESQVEETTKLLKGNEEYKEKYSTLMESFKKELETKDKEIANIFKKNAVKEALTSEGGKHVELLMKDIDFEKLTIDGENKVVGLTEIVTNIKTSYSDLFIKTEVASSTNTNTKTNTKNDGTDTNNWESVANSLV